MDRSLLGVDSIIGAGAELGSINSTTGLTSSGVRVSWLLHALSDNAPMRMSAAINGLMEFNVGAKGNKTGAMIIKQRNVKHEP